MKQFRHIRRDERGAGAVEFALAAPVLFTIVIGISQLGLLFFANSGLKHSVEQAARRAAVYPEPTRAQVIAELNATVFGLGDGTLTPVVSTGREASTCMYFMDISLSYQVPLDFIFFRVAPITVGHSRRVYTLPAAPAPCATPGASGSTSSSTSTGSTSSGSVPTSSTTTTSGGTTTPGNGNGSSG